MSEQRRQIGFALVEALVALLILSLGILALAQLQSRMAQHSALARQQVQAMAFAQERVEQWRAATDQQFEAIAPGQDHAASGPGEGTSFERRWQVAATGAGAGATKTMQVQVQWAGRDGQDQEVQLRSLMLPNDGLRAALLMSPLSPAQTQLGADGRPAAVLPHAVPIAGSSRWQRMQVPGLAGDGGAWMVFDARSGDVAYRCSAVPSSEAALSACLALAARAMHGTVHLGPTITLAATTLLLADASVAPCVHAPVPGLPQAFGFLCLVPVQDHDGSARTPPVWSGRLQFSARSSIGDAVQVCRYAHNASQTDGQYVNVAQTLFHQNHVLVTQDCPAGTHRQL
jgi:type IV pilus modification protein PilV